MTACPHCGQSLVRDWVFDFDRGSLIAGDAEIGFSPEEAAIFGLMVKRLGAVVRMNEMVKVAFGLLDLQDPEHGVRNRLGNIKRKMQAAGVAVPHITCVRLSEYALVERPAPGAVS